jgi:hypothetical protein
MPLIFAVANRRISRGTTSLRNGPGKLVVAGNLAAMERITLHVPQLLNDGSCVPAETLEDYEDAMGDIALRSLLASGSGSHGAVVSPGETGVWWDQDGRKYREPYTLYSIDVVESDLAFDLTRELAERARVELGQVAVYLTRGPIGAVIVTAYVTA